jgi:hypothetical protein
MKSMSGRLAIAAGVVLTLGGILAFSLLSPGMTLGEETDVGLPTDVDDGPADPPASVPDDTDDVGPDASGPDVEPPAALPDTGSGPAGDSTHWSLLLLTALLTVAGVAMTGAGMVAARQAQRSRQ